MCDSSVINCCLTIEWLNSDKAVTKTSKWKNSVLSLVRNEFRDIYLQVNVGDTVLKFHLANIMIHKKFISEGKATINFNSERVIVYISNAPVSHLLLFLKTLFIKMTSSKSSPKVPLREKLLSNKDRKVEEISPINAKDATRLKNGTAANAGISSTTQVTKMKRKNIDLSKSDEKKKQCLESLIREKLTDEQKLVVDAVLRGSNIFFTGSAGTGKSFLLRHIIAALAPGRTVVTASTGAAASLITGTTLHAFAGIGNGEGGLEKCLQLARRPQILPNWTRCKHLIIDEISMVNGQYFEKVEKVARIVKGVDKPFGGIQLIVCGDFLQLPPVVRRNIPQDKKFCFQFDVWRACEFQTYQLVKVHRQKDPEFVQLLNNIRVGRVTNEMSMRLASTASQALNFGDILATKLCSHNQQVTAINTYHLDKLDGIERRFTAEDSSPSAASLLDDQTPAESQLVLKVGAQVMLTKNVNIAKGLVNGARGVITKFNKDGFPTVRFVSGVEHTIQREKWLAKSPSGTTFTRKQIPLKLAWAFSIHKSQGLTLDCVEISLSSVFEAGQAYVALSRAKSLDSLRVIGFDPKQVWADPDVLRFYKKCSQSQISYIPLGAPSNKKPFL